MPRLTILNHWQGPVDISINNGAAVTLPAGGRLERVLNGPVQLHATATGNERRLIPSSLPTSAMCSAWTIPSPSKTLCSGWIVL